MRWERECGAPAAACTHRLPEVAGSLGVTAAPFCLRVMEQACPVRFASTQEALGEIAGCAIVAGCRLERLRGRRLVDLYDVLPAIRISEWDVVLAFARDYTARGVPWAVVKRGEVYMMLKRKVG